jgi:hypothetical protein
MRISDEQLKKVIEMGGLSLVPTEDGFVASPRPDDAGLIKSLTTEILEMPDRETMIADLKARIEAGTYNPSGAEIADVMIRRAIADRIR